MIRMVVTFAALSLLLANMIQAQNDNTRPGKRQEKQQQRIENGKADGSLNQKEAERLQAQETLLNQKIEHDKKDGGKFTAKEKRQAERGQDEMSKKIYKQRHDKQKQ